MDRYCIFLINFVIFSATALTLCLHVMRVISSYSLLDHFINDCLGRFFIQIFERIMKVFKALSTVGLVASQAPDPQKVCTDCKVG